MLIQGPLMLNWRRRKWGLLPRIENACLQGSQPPTMERLRLWLTARVQVPTRPDWFFVKLHSHGGPEHHARVVLGEPMARFHRDLARYAQEHPEFSFHYVTAREAYNLVKAAEAGWSGSVAGARNFELTCECGAAPAGIAGADRAGGARGTDGGEQMHGLAGEADDRCNPARTPAEIGKSG
jgi:hypothetical protein